MIFDSSYYKHFKTICKHKYYVFQECKACGILWQGIIHDLSKFGITEFASSARHFQGNRSPIEAEKESIGYSLAWLHHKGCNKHHWEYWTDFNDKDGSVITNKMPIKYTIEMICDWIGAGKAYSQGTWTQSDPLKYYCKVRSGRHFHIDTETLILELLHIIEDEGLEGFHIVARALLKAR